MTSPFWNEELDSNTDVAIQLKRNGDYSEAYRIYQALDFKYPNNALLLFSWAKTIIALEKYEEAKYVLEKAKKLYEELNNPEWWQCAEHLKQLTYSKDSKEFQEYMRAVSGNRDWVYNSQLVPQQPQPYQNYQPKSEKNNNIKVLVVLVIIFVVIMAVVSQNSNNSYSPAQSDDIEAQKNADSRSTAKQQEVIKNTPKQASYKINRIDKKYYNSNHTEWIDFYFELPKLSGNFAGIPKINKYFEDIIGQYINSYPNLFELEDDDEGRVLQGEESGFYRSVYYKVERFSENIISMSLDINGCGMNCGTWHQIKGVTFDMNTGKPLILHEIFGIDKTKFMEYIYEYVSNEILLEILTGEDHVYFFNDPYKDGYNTIREFKQDNFFLTERDLVITYDPYTLASGVFDVKKYIIPLQKIIDHFGS